MPLVVVGFNPTVSHCHGSGLEWELDMEDDLVIMPTS